MNTLEAIKSVNTNVQKLSRKFTVRKVSSEAERQAVYRFRYQIYVEEMGRPQKDADPHRRWIKDRLDSDCELYAAFTPDGNIVGTVRTNYSSNSDLGFYESFYRCDRFNELVHGNVSITTRLMTEPSYRRSTLAFRLACATYVDIVSNGIKLNIIDCNDHLVEFFRKLGFLEGFKDWHSEYGHVNVMHLWLTDRAHLFETGSPFLKYLDAIKTNQNISTTSKHPPTSLTSRRRKGEKIMTNEEKIASAFEQVFKDFTESKPIQRLLDGDFTLNHYRWFLRQIFHHARENPQLQALATVYFRGHERDVVKRFYKHAASEIGHDQLALNDLEKLGENTATIPFENPLPATSALLAYCYYQIQNRDPVGYLGYLYFLEFTPTKGGEMFIQALKNAGATDDSLSFLIDHTVVDVGHNNLMKTYIRDLVRYEHQADTVIYAMQVTGQLYASMLEQAMEQADRPKVFGLSGWERANSSAPGFQSISIEEQVADARTG